MDYDAVLAQVFVLLQQEKRLSYRVLKQRPCLGAAGTDGGAAAGPDGAGRPPECGLITPCAGRPSPGTHGT